MTAHAHDPIAPRDSARPSQPSTTIVTSAGRPRWLIPGLGIGLMVAGLVAAGIVSLSTVLYVGLFGGMILMHMGGHGGHGNHGGGGSPEARDLRNPTAGAQKQPSGSGEEETLTNETRSETDDDDKRSSHGCH